MIPAGRMSTRGGGFRRAEGLGFDDRRRKGCGTASRRDCSARAASAIVRAVRPPPLPHQLAVLRDVLDRVTRAATDGARTPVVVFDLDATLYDNRPRTLRILEEYAAEVRAEFPDVAASLATLEASHIHYLLSDTLRGCGLTHPELVKDVTAYWRDRFFTDEYCRYDVPLDGARDYVHACHAAGAVVVYMTGRDVPGMFLGTVASLRDSGFPIGIAGTECVLKPDATLPDEAFKRTALPSLLRIGDVLAFFDNEPANCNVALQVFPHALSVVLDTQRVPGAPPPDAGVETISDFRLD
jgi:hypothetical protein